MRLPGLLALALTAGCRGGPEAPPLCPGTPLAESCAGAFFAPLSACFRPSGVCRRMGDPAIDTEVTYCWDSGAKATVALTATGLHGELSQGGSPCYTITTVGKNPITARAAGSGGALTYDDDTNVLTCPDGSTTVIPEAELVCEEFKALLEGPDSSGCTPGACP
jgi:hypothetical protein